VGSWRPAPEKWKRGRGRSQWYSGSGLSFVLCLYCLRPTSLLASWAHGPLSREPPPGHKKLRGAGLCTMCTHVTGIAPSAFLATRRPRCLIGSQSVGQSETCPREAEAREGREITFWFLHPCHLYHLRPTSLLASWAPEL
jgi:hypothetical protein